MNAEKRIDDSTLRSAEDMVTSSIDRIEHVMEELTAKVEQASHKIQHVVDLGARQKEELLNLKDKAQETVVPLLRQGRDYGRQIISQAKENRDPLIYGALAISIGWLAYELLVRRGVGVKGALKN